MHTLCNVRSQAADPSYHWARGGVHPGQVTTITGPHRDKQNKQPSTLTHTRKVNFRVTRVFLGSVRKMENPEIERGEHTNSTQKGKKFLSQKLNLLVSSHHPHFEKTFCYRSINFSRINVPQRSQ